ncbi:hypothetical protein V8F20_005230 [Naviculisporaceae sp. PSN 640]
MALLEDDKVIVRLPVKDTKRSDWANRRLADTVTISVGSIVRPASAWPSKPIFAQSQGRLRSQQGSLESTLVFRAKKQKSTARGDPTVRSREHDRISLSLRHKKLGKAGPAEGGLSPRSRKRRTGANHQLPLALDESPTSVPMPPGRLLHSDEAPRPTVYTTFLWGINMAARTGCQVLEAVLSGTWWRSKRESAEKAQLACLKKSSAPHHLQIVQLKAG